MGGSYGDAPLYATLLQEWGVLAAHGVRIEFSREKPYLNTGDVVVVTELARFPDGTLSEQSLLVALTPQGWRVLNVIPATER
jgi:hypothetical protein